MASSKLLVLLINLFFIPAFGLWPEAVDMSQGTTVLWMSPDIKLLRMPVNQTGSVIPRQALYADLMQFLESGYGRIFGSADDALAFPRSQSEMAVIESAFRRTIRTITSTKFVPWKFYPRSMEFEPSTNESREVINYIYLNQESGGTAHVLDAQKFFGGDESYELKLSENGVCQISSKSTLGTIRAFQSMEQLFYAHSDSSRVYTPFAPVKMVDSPKWPHRGLNMDIARNVFTPADVKRTIDAMASCKMSRLHIHATDAQSWPIEIPALPTLAENGAYRSYLKWSPGDLKAVQLYGLQRGISVFVEIDMPGHTGSVAHAFPDLIAAFNQSDWSSFAVEPPSGSIKLNSTAVYNFLNVLFSDLLPRLSPYTNLFHNGGDEVYKNAYLLDDTINSNSITVLQPLVQRFMSNVTGIVRQAGFTPLVWEDMILEWNLTFPLSGENMSASSDVIVQAWKGAENFQKVLEKGFRVLFGDNRNWYLDCGHGGFINPYPSGFSPPGVPYNTSGGVPSQIGEPFLDYCNPMKNWRSIYLYDPLANITEDVQHLIEGGETHSWSEQLDPVDLDSRIWPRAAAAAEVMWSGPRKSSQIENASRRLGEWRERAVRDHSVQAAMVQMTWCLMEGGCNL